MAFTKRQITLLTLGGVILLLTALVGSSLAFRSHRVFASSSKFNAPGNVLISDQFNNRVIEVDRQHNIVWSFGSGNPKLCNPGPGAIIGLNDAERLSGGLTLLAGTGIPPSTPESSIPKGCADNRVIVVNQAGQIVWQYGKAGVTGSGFNQLNTPVFAIQLPNHNIMIVDQVNERVIEVDKSSKKIVWQYGQTGVTGSGFNQLNNPNSAELLPNGHILIADENNNRVIEVTRDHQIFWQYSQGLSLAAFASRLPNGDTLITDSNNFRIVEINQAKQVVFQYFTNTAPNSNAMPLPTNAVRLANGNTCIADQFNDRAFIIDSNKATKFQYGMTNMDGTGHNRLNSPYTAFVIGDYTGQTPPPQVF
jgi:hypothetical protein